MNAKEFGNEIRNIRKKHKYSLRKAEQRSGISYAYISKLENGDRNIPKPETLRKLAKGIGISEEEIFKLAGLESSSSETSNKPEWANENDVLELDKFLETNGEMTFKGVELDKEQRERVTQVLTQVFWNELQKKKKQNGDLNNYGKNE
ncbi:helix-turn-helix domain-containing protein [Fructilactobacillus frigidiflavus]|uniref:helix-turn-helix domain-containing protein n=1 Tax=Fructilactobacillus frigidiflavus TaxID=3242688 RepID=UPI003757E3A6